MSFASLNAASIFNAIGGGSPLSIMTSLLKPSYVIKSEDGSVTLPFDGLKNITASGSANVVTAPVEKGKYQTLNKVKEPNQIKCEILLDGLTGFSGNIPNIFNMTLTSQNASLKIIQEMIGKAAIYNIETPKGNYDSYDLVNWSYQVSSQTGVTLLTVSLYFTEIMQQMEVTLGSPQSEEKPINNEDSPGPDGVAATAEQQAGTSQPTANDTGKELSFLNDALDFARDTYDTVTGTINNGLDYAANEINSAMDAVNTFANETPSERVVRRTIDELSRKVL
ncbi:hypothetical protein ACME8T_09195 [Morganella morganii]|uniref:hypothetical protein n=1 Tax=Morganella morganii TaxID=582 RepID=UPI003D05E71E